MQDNTERAFIEDLLKDAPTPVNCAKLCVPPSAEAQVGVHRLVVPTPNCVRSSPVVQWCMWALLRSSLHVSAVRPRTLNRRQPTSRCSRMPFHTLLMEPLHGYLRK